MAFLVARTGLKTNGRCAFVESSQGQKVGLKGGDQSKLDTEEEKGQNKAKLFHKEQACKLLTSIFQKKSKMPEVLQTAGQAKVK